MGTIRYYTQKTPRLETELRSFISTRMGAHYLDHVERYKQSPDGQHKQVLVTVFFVSLEDLPTRLPAHDQTLAQYVVALYRKPSALRYLLPHGSEEIQVRAVTVEAKLGPVLSSKIWEHAVRNS